MPGKFSRLMMAFYQYLVDETTVAKKEDGWWQIMLPFVDRNGDGLLVVAHDDGGGRITMTDEGFTLADLAICGVDILAPKFKKALAVECTAGVHLTDSETLTVIVDDEDDFPTRLFELIRAMLAVNALGPSQEVA